MTPYGRFCRMKLDTPLIGFERRAENSPYFCTPQGARIIGWAGVDGIHYCFIRRFGEMVFAVEPMAGEGQFVYPLARNFEDFLRLLLCCGDAGILQQAHSMDRAQFEAFCRENAPTDPQRAVLRRISRAFSLRPMEAPFDYLQAVYKDFDPKTIPFPREYYEWVAPAPPQRPAWKVYFHSGFWSHQGRDRAGIPLGVGQSLDWGGVTVYLPAVYSCAAGLVADICIGADKQAIRDFIDQWRPYQDREDRLSAAEQEYLDFRNPLHLDFDLEARVNGKHMRQKYGTSRSWLPEDCLPEGVANDLKSRWLMEQYKLDPERGWTIHRISLPWATRRRPKLSSLSLTLRPHPERIPGPIFRLGGVGDSVRLTHPLTGAGYTLTVTDYEAQTIQVFAHDETREYPSHCVTMEFLTEPPLPIGAIQVTDNAPGDPPRPKNPPSGFGPTATDSVGLIGGADGPTALVLAREGRPVHGAVSSLYFQAPEQIDWRVTFCQSTREALEITIR